MNEGRGRGELEGGPRDDSHCDELVDVPMKDDNQRTWSVMPKASKGLEQIRSWWTCSGLAVSSYTP